MKILLAIIRVLRGLDDLGDPLDFTRNGDKKVLTLEDMERERDRLSRHSFR